MYFYFSQINGERVDGADLKFAEECLERARPVVTLVIKQFRSETESKYVLCSPTESDHEVPTDASPAHGYNMTVIPSQENRTPGISSYNPDFLPSDETSPENIPTGVFQDYKRAPELLTTGGLSSESLRSEKQPAEHTGRFSGSLEPVKQDFEVERNVENLSADESYSEEKVTSSDKRENDAIQEPENEEYQSDDDDLLLKVNSVYPAYFCME